MGTTTVWQSERAPRQHGERGAVAARGDVYALCVEELTFLFTDIERSTGLVERLGSGYAAVLERERELVASAVAAAGGRVVDARGDELFAVFPAAAAGVDAAVAAQRAIEGHRWPAPVRVRMGVHTGRATAAGDGYVGLAVHHAARVAQAAHGGEIIVSGATCAALPGGAVAVRDLGEFDLRGIPCATRLYRVVAPGLGADFPRPDARPSSPTATRVALADDSVLLREGIAALLEEAGLEVVGQAGTAADLLDLIEATLPDVAIVDIRMPPTKTDEGIRAAETIKSRHPQTGVLLLSSHVEVENALQLFGRETSGLGYLLKERVGDVHEFVAAVLRVASGGIAIDSSIVAELGTGSWPQHAHEVLSAAAERAAIVGA
jgi:class 3 adenylate cyclase/DNA-binding NarL/FixJ family response regulator